MTNRRPPRLLTARIAAVVPAWMTMSSEFVPCVAVAEGSFLNDEEPCSIPPALYFRGSRFGSSSGSVDIHADAGDQLLGIDCDDSGSTSSVGDQLLDVDCDDDDDGASGQALDVKSGHQASSSADQPSNSDLDGLDRHQQVSGVLCDSLDSSAPGGAVDLGALSRCIRFIRRVGSKTLLLTDAE